MNRIHFCSRPQPVSRLCERLAGPILALLILLVPGPAFGSFLYGLSGPGSGGNRFLSIDPVTGQGTAIGPEGPDGYEALEILPDGRFLAISWDGVSQSDLPGFTPNELFSIDPQTGVATLIGTVGNYYFIEGLAYGDGVLYGSADPDADPITDHAKVLIRIDPDTAAATEIGAFGDAFQNVEALAYGPDGTLYGADIGTDTTSPALIRIDKETGEGTLIATLPTDMLLAALTFGPDGVLYGATIPARSGPSLPSRLVRVDPITGEITDIGPIGFDIVQGLAAVPEPGAITLFGVAGLLLAGRALILRKSRRNPSAVS